VVPRGARMLFVEVCFSIDRAEGALSIDTASPVLKVLAMRLSFGYALAQPLYPSPIHSPNLRRPRLSHGRILFYSRAAAPFTPSGFDRLSNPALVWMIIQVRAHGQATRACGRIWSRFKGRRYSRS
jgi:hypothetical protein